MSDNTTNENNSTEMNTQPEKKRKKAPLIIGIVVCVVIACIIILFCTRDIRSYSSAKKLYENGDFSKAESEFEELNGYKDSQDWVLKSKYELAKQYFDDKEYQKAIDLFTELADYDDSEELLNESNHGLEVQNDTTAPVITIPEGKEQYKCFTGDEIDTSDIGATAEDDVSGDCEVKYDTSSVDTNTEGDYTMKLTAEDEAKNTTTAEIQVTVATRGIGDTVETSTPFGSVEVTLDRIHWAGSDWTEGEDIPDDVGIILVNMTVKNIDYSDSDNGDIFYADNAGFSFTDDTNTALTDCGFSYGDGLYGYLPEVKEGQTVRVLVPLYAPTDTKTVILHLPNNATIKADL